MLKKIILYFLLILTINFSFASTWQNLNLNNLNWNNCNNEKFKIIWEENIKKWVINSYEVKNFKDNVWWKIKRDKKVVFTFTGIRFNYAFQKQWNVEIIADFKKWNCTFHLTKNTNIYKKIVLVIKDEKSSFIPYEQLKNKWIYLQIKKIDEVKDFDVKNSDYILIDQKYIVTFLNKYINKFDFQNKKIVLFIGSYKWFYSKFLIPYLKNVYKKNIYVYDPNEFLNVIDDIYQEKSLDNNKLFVVSSYGNKIYFPLSYFSNKLIENGVSVDKIWLILVALIGILIIAIFRQIIWFSVFWVYTPLIFVILITLIGYKITLILFLLSILSNILTHFITKKIYILYSSKITLNYILYVILSIMFLWVLVKTKLIWEFSISNALILAFFIMPLLSKNLVKEETNIFSKSFWIFVLEFSIISSILFVLFKIETIKYVLIAYPDLLWILIILTIIIWRFSGLQLLEYIRFYPLIKKWFQEEE